MRHTICNLFLASLFLSSVACAHDDAYLDSHTTPHGGQMRMAGPYHLEALTDQGRLLVFVTDHAGTPIATTGWHGRATVLAGKQKSQYDLQPAGSNELRSTGQIKNDRNMVMVLAVTPASGEPEQARYTRLTPLAMHEEHLTK